MHGFAGGGVIGAEFTTNPVAPVARLDGELLVAEAVHEGVEDAGGVLKRPAFGRAAGPAENPEDWVPHSGKAVRIQGQSEG